MVLVANQYDLGLVWLDRLDRLTSDDLLDQNSWDHGGDCEMMLVAPWAPWVGTGKCALPPGAKPHIERLLEE